MWQLKRQVAARVPPCDVDISPSKQHRQQQDEYEDGQCNVSPVQCGARSCLCNWITGQVKKFKVTSVNVTREPTRPLTVWGWQTRVSATDYYINTNTWMQMCTGNQAGRCLLTQYTWKGEVELILLDCGRRPVECWLLWPFWAHCTPHNDRLTF